MPLNARSVAEAHLYLDLRGCSRADRTSRLVADGDELLTIYGCSCGGERREFVFSIPTPEARTGRYGDEEPSSIIGPGELLAWSEHLALTVPADPAGLSREQRQEGQSRMQIAAECLAEILKFIPPGASKVPEASFRSEADRTMYRSEPRRFERERLEAVAASYRAIAARLST